jgi:hypothetical protein
MSQQSRHLLADSEVIKRILVSMTKQQEVTLTHSLKYWYTRLGKSLPGELSSQMLVTVNCRVGVTKGAI